MNDTQKNNYVIFGGSGGIGSALATRLARGGQNILIAGHTAEKVNGLADQLGVAGATVDATQFEQVESTLRDAKERWGKIDGVVNCVGSLLLKPASLTSESEFREAIDKNLTSAFAVVRGAAQFLRGNGGSVVLMSSAAARRGLANHEAIAAAKAGVIGLTLSAASTLASAKIRVNAVAPGMVKTPLTERIWSKETAAKASRDFHAAGRLGEPDDIASMIEWLLSPANDWVTGQVFGVDGGLATVSPR